VTWISDQAEFTPKNIQTAEERVNLVYAVKISIQNAQRRLKAGMPADAELPTNTAGARSGSAAR
jgi:HlyD family secretion protein